MAAVMSRIATVMRTYPLTRGMASYAVIWPIGSIIQQSIQGRKELDYGRIARFSFYGCCFVAPTLYTWMKIAGKLFPKPGLHHALYKALLEQVTYTPAAMTCFYYFMTLLEGGTLTEACEEVEEKFLPTYKVGVCVWPVLQTFNFTVVPPANRVPFVSVCSLCWTTFLAYMKQLHGNKIEPLLVDVLVEQVTYGPFATITFYTAMTFLEGKSWQDAKDELNAKFWPTYKTALLYWPVVQTVNFTCVPERNRVPFVSVFSVIWTTFLAFMKEREIKKSSLSRS